MSDLIDHESEARLRRLRVVKRVFAPLRAALFTSLAAVAAGAGRLAQGEHPRSVSMVLFLLFAYIVIERWSIAPRIAGWRADRRTKGALAIAFFGSLLVAFADRGRGPVVELPAGLETAALWAGVALVVVGGAIRQWAIRTLGQFFTDRARVVEGHQLIQHGPYRRVRHPAYSGLVLVFLGFPLALGSALGLALMASLGVLAIFMRLRVEEALLADYFGIAWDDYAARTPRLLPF